MKNKNIKFLPNRKRNNQKAYCLDLRSKGGNRKYFVSYEAANNYYHTIDKVTDDKKLTESFSWTFDQLLKEFKPFEYNRISDGEILDNTYIEKISAIEIVLQTTVDDEIFGKTKVSDLTMGHLKLQTFKQLKLGGRKNTGRSHERLRNIKTFLTTFLNFAIICNCRTDNPIMGMKLGKNKGVEHEKLLKPKAQRIAPEIVKKVISLLPSFRVHGPSMELVANFAIQTGLRAGEQRALPWYNIDFENCIVSVEDALHRNSIEKRTKTKNSVREIPLKAQMVKDLKSLWLSQGKPSKNNLVFPKNEPGSVASNRPEDMSSWYGYLQRACKSAGVQQFSWHDLRHYFASVMLQTYPNNIWKVTHLMGHADVGITQRDYGHWLEDKEQKIQDQKDMEKVNF
tara:strand:+ start:1280 stop:2470 length:1191 start_codon:yes stop_codon:yes gene_type:complete